MTPQELAAKIQEALVDLTVPADEGRRDEPVCLTVDVIDDEQGTLGVELVTGERYFITVEVI